MFKKKPDIRLARELVYGDYQRFDVWWSELNENLKNDCIQEAKLLMKNKLLMKIIQGGIVDRTDFLACECSEENLKFARGELSGISYILEKIKDISLLEKEKEEIPEHKFDII
jgi:hypothetical protein